MRLSVLTTISLTLLCCAAALSGVAEVIDRIAVTVERQVITESEIVRQIKITAFLNGEKPNFSGDNKRATAERLVEQMLIRREISSTGYNMAVPEATINLYAQLRTRYNNDEFSQALTEYGITDEEVRKAIEWQATLLEFVEVRFRPGIQIPESELKEYYESEFSPKVDPAKRPAFEDARAQIESILTAQRVDNALDRWLGQARTQTRIRFREEVFR